MASAFGDIFKQIFDKVSNFAKAKEGQSAPKTSETTEANQIVPEVTPVTPKTKKSVIVEEDEEDSPSLFNQSSMVSNTPEKTAETEGSDQDGLSAGVQVDKPSVAGLVHSAEIPLYDKEIASGLMSSVGDTSGTDWYQQALDSGLEFSPKSSDPYQQAVDSGMDLAAVVSDDDSYNNLIQQATNRGDEGAVAALGFMKQRDKVGKDLAELDSRLSKEADEIPNFFTDPIGHFVGNGNIDWSKGPYKELEDKIKQSNGKYMMHLGNDPDRFDYLDEYEAIFSQRPEYNDNEYSFAENLKNSRLSDVGNSNKEGLVSDTMTGAEYKQYRLTGIPGRPIEKIDDWATYDKLSEYRNYGFIPYAPTDEDIFNMELQHLMKAPNKAANELANSRTSAFNYTINLGDRKIDGRAFDDASILYLRRMRDLLDSDDGSLYNEEDDPDPSIATPITSGEFRITLDDGEEVSVPGGNYKLITEPQGYIDDNGEFVYTKPNFTVEFKNGERFDFESPDDFEQNVKAYGYKVAEADDKKIWVPDLILDDGTRINYVDAVRIATDRDPRDPSDGLSYDFGPLNLGMPRKFSEGPIEDGIENLPGTIWDIFASSSPYFKWTPGIIRSGSAAEAALSGVDPSTVGADGVGSLVAEDIDDNLYWSNIGFNFGTPLTEKVAGGIGGKSQIFNRFLKPRIERKLGGRLEDKPLADFGVDVAGEAIEEVVGNAAEEAAISGTNRWYGNPVLDEDGNEVVDETGHTVKEEDTSFPETIWNYFKDAPDAAAAGALMGGIMKAPKTAAGLARNAKLKKKGIDPNWRIETKDDVDFEVPDSLRTFYREEGEE